MTTPTETQAEVQKTDKELNFERLRKQLESERSARLQAEKRAQELEQERLAVRKPIQKEEEDEESDEPYVDHKHLNRKLAKWEERIEKTIEEKAQQKAQSLLEQEKQQSYIKQNPDFQETLTADNIQKFAEAHPAIAERMLRMPDNFDRQALLYEQIKALNAKKEQKPSVQETIDKNRKGPYYQPTGMGTAPYSQVGDFSPSGQKNAYAKLQELKSKLRI